MAITLETTYGRAGYAPRWITPEDLREFGEAVAKALAAYHGFETGEMQTRQPLTEEMLRRKSRAIPLKYPDLYPPLMADEGKE